MKTREELHEIKEEYETVQSKLTELSDDELQEITSGAGVANPVSGLSREKAEKIAKTLGDGEDHGSWRSMSGEQFMKWWESSNRSALKSASPEDDHHGYHDGRSEEASWDRN